MRRLGHRTPQGVRRLPGLLIVRTLLSVVAYWSWAVPRLRRYCHRCELEMWGWQNCRHAADGYLL